MTNLNIQKLMAYREVDGHVLTVAELSRRYPIQPLGTLTYYGVVPENVRYLKQTGRALQPDHRSVIDDLLAALYAGYAEEITFQLVLEAIQDPGRYDYVVEHLDLIEHLAVDLSGYQTEAVACGKRLDVILRFGSEMNDEGGTAYAKDPSAFISVFRAVRQIFSDLAPEVIFPFSPALRADIDTSNIGQYWPGDDHVDLVGATWYVHGENQQKLGLSNMAAYFSQYAIKNKPLSLDEFGGAEGEGADYYDNDGMLNPMFRQIELLAESNIHFEYGTIFLDDNKYGVDARLRFL